MQNMQDDTDPSADSVPTLGATILPPVKPIVEESDPSIVYRRVILMLATLLVANPAIIFLLVRNAISTLLITAACVVVMQFIAFRGWRLVSVYAFNGMALVSLFVHAEVIFVYGFPDYVVENLYTIEDGYYFNRPRLDQTFTTKE